MGDSCDRFAAITRHGESWRVLAYFGRSGREVQSGAKYLLDSYFPWWSGPASIR